MPDQDEKYAAEKAERDQRAAEFPNEWDLAKPAGGGMPSRPLDPDAHVEKPVATVAARKEKK